MNTDGADRATAERLQTQKAGVTNRSGAETAEEEKKRTNQIPDTKYQTPKIRYQISDTK